MNGWDTPHHVVGKVANLSLSGLGQNSGEMLLTLDTETGTLQVRAAHMDSNYGPNGVEPGVFAGYVSMAGAAVTQGWALTCVYFERDVNRIQSLSLSPPTTKSNARP